MRGLDPRIHQAKDASLTMDCWVKPGNDEARANRRPEDRRSFREGRRN
jgi:hypothetical protein